MPSEKIRVPFPIKGLDSSTQLDAQPTGTTRDARNVRGLCPRTGRNRGAQRAPLEKYTTDTGPGSRTQALAVVSYDQTRNKYTQLNNESNVDVSPEDVTKGFEWGRSPVDGELYSVVTDIYGNVYTLTADRQIYKHSADGELLESLSIVGFETEEVVRRIQVDALGNIYAATSRPNNSTLYRFEPDEEVGYTTRYRWKSPDQIIDFQLKFGQIYAIAEKTMGTYRSYISILYNLDSDLGPYSIFEKPVPSPVGGIAVSNNGSIYVTCPKNDLRNTTPDSGNFGAGIVSWTPHELGYNGDPDAPTYTGHKRIHGWLDAQKLSGVEGQEILSWPDIKQDGTKYYDVNSPFEAIGDTVERSAEQGAEYPQIEHRNVQGNISNRPHSGKPPHYYVAGDGLTPGGFGGKPCIYFNGDDTYQIQDGEASGGYWVWWEEGDHVTVGQALYWPVGLGPQNRTSDLADNENSLSLVPGLNKVKYTIFFVVRIQPDGVPRGLYTCNHGHFNEPTWNNRWSLICNIGTDPTSSSLEGPPWSATSPGNLHLAPAHGGNSSEAWVNANTGWNAGGIPTSAWNWIVDATYTTIGPPKANQTESQNKTHPENWRVGEHPLEENAPSNTCIIAVHHGGGDRGDSTWTEKSCWRVNGQQVGKSFTFRGDQGGGYTEQWYNYASQILGSPYMRWQPGVGVSATEKMMDDFYLYGGDSANSTTSTPWHQSDADTADIWGFKGGVAEVFTVLGETGVEPNDTVPDDHINLADASGTGNTPDGGTITEVEKIEGYLAWKWGLEKTLSIDHPYIDAPPDTTVDDSEQEPPEDTFDLGALNSPDPILLKYDGNNGELIWSLSASGMGHGVVVDDKNQVITFGQTVDATVTDSEGNEIDNDNARNPTTGALEPDATMRKIIDLGQTFVADDVGDRKAWTINNDTIPENAYAYPQILLDRSGDVYVPSDPDQEKMLGGGGVYKVNVSDGSVDFHIPSPVNYFMEGGDTALAVDGISTGIGAQDLLSLPWSGAIDFHNDSLNGEVVNPGGSFEVEGAITAQYNTKFKNVAKHPITGEFTVSGVRDTPVPYPNTTYHDAPSPADWTYTLPKYRSLLYSRDIETSYATTPSHEVVQQIDNFMISNTLAPSTPGWVNATDGGEQSSERAYVSAPDLTPPRNESGGWGGASLLSIEPGQSEDLMVAKVIPDRGRMTTGSTYLFSVWIAQEALDAADGSVRTADNKYAMIDLLQMKPGTNRRTQIKLDLTDGSTIGFTYADGGAGTGTYGSDTFTAAKGLGTTETRIWHRVWVTLLYDAGFATSGLRCRIYPISGGTATDYGAIHAWGPMLIEGTEPVSHNHPSWGGLHPTSEGNPSWMSHLWLDGLTTEERASDGGDAVLAKHPSYDSVIDTALTPGDEVFYSFYIAKVAYDADGELAGPTDYDPNPTTVSANYDTGTRPWMVTGLKSRIDGVVEQITWHIQASDGIAMVRNFDANEGTGEWASQSPDPPYGNNVISEDAGNYWRVGIWFKYFAERSDGGKADFFFHQIHSSGSLSGTTFTFQRAQPITCHEFFVNPGPSSHPDAPGGMQFPTPTLAPNAPNAGSCLSIATPFKAVEVDETGLNDDSEFTVRQKSPEFVYFTQRGNEPTLYDRMIRKHRVVAATPIIGENQSARANKLISVNNGSLYNVSTPSEEGASYTAISEGDSVLSADAAQIQWTQHQSKLYFVDGKRVVVYDPAIDTVEDLESKQAGEVPKKPRLIASWRNRLVLARTIDEPHNWHMSAIGDPENWDYFPALPIATQAISGNNARAGLASDLINTLIPYNDDLMIMGGDHSIARMTGDPMAGGQIDIVSPTVGMAFGSSWTIIPDGTLFFVSTEGRIFAMSPDGRIEKISNKWVEHEVLEEWNGAYFQVKLVWNNKDDGLHILFLPSALGGEGGSSGLAMNALFWERVNNAWWRDTFAEDVAPYSAVARDGDQPQDRTVLFGTGDGTVLNWAKQNTDSTNNSDYNDNAINAWVFIDVASETISGAGQMRVTSAQAVMSNNTLDTSMHLYASDTAASLPSNQVAGSWLRAGRSDRLPLRGKGTNIAIRLKASSINSNFSCESIQLMVTPTGRANWQSEHTGHGHPE